MATIIYYDGDCPFCTRYTSLLRLQEAVGTVKLIDLRKDLVAAEQLEDAGFDLDEGMVLDLAGARHHGADAVHRLALLSTKSGAFNKLNAALFRHPRFARMAYPVLRAGRSATLFTLGRARISASPASELSFFAIFAHAFGMYAFADALYLLFQGRGGLVTAVFGVAGLYLLARPRSPRLFCLIAALLCADAFTNIPSQSNHAILVGFTLLVISASGAYIWLRGRSWSAFMQAFSPVARCLLLVMYFFGVFHKLNTGFLDPEVSCAVELWKTMPRPLPTLDGLWWRHAIIYGTLIGEAIMLLGLLFQRTRYIAIMTGIAFHSMLALSDYGFYLAFSMLTIALHLMFISPAAAARIVNAPTWKLLQRRIHTGTGSACFLVWAGAMAVLADLGHFNSVALLWLPWSIWLICLVGRYGRERTGETTLGPPIWSRVVLLNLISLAFAINGLLPYMGLKTAQSMNMFANLTYENGKSNHLLLPGPHWFGYQQDTVKPISVNGAPFATRMGEGKYMTYYALLDWLDRNPSLRVAFARGNLILENQTATTLATDIAAELHPRWVRNWFHFKAFNDFAEPVCEPGY